MIFNTRTTHVKGVRQLNGKIYVDVDASDEEMECLVKESENIWRSLYTKKSIQKCYSETMYSLSNKLDKLVVGEKETFGDGDEKIEITRETQNLYSIDLQMVSL